MVVLVLSAAPASLRGALTRWLMEVSPGVFVGHLSARVREQVWELVRAYLGDGRALLVWSTRSEQHYSVASLGHDREPVDVEGCLVMRTPYQQVEGAMAVPGAEGVLVHRGTPTPLPQLHGTYARFAVKAQGLF